MTPTLVTERIGAQGNDVVERGLTTRIADTDRDGQPDHIEGKYISVSGLAHEIHYLEGGAHNDKTLIFLHGAAFSAKTWQEIGVLELLLEKGFRVIAVDLPGKFVQGDCCLCPKVRGLNR